MSEWVEAVARMGIEIHEASRKADLSHADAERVSQVPPTHDRPLERDREAEIRADEIERILTHILTGPRSPATNALERRLAELRDA